MLNNAEGFSGHIVNFAGTAPDAAHSDAIDLVGFDYNASTFSETYNGSDCVLIVRDGSHTASLTFANFDGAFVFASDGHGGTLITDPASTNTSSASVSIGGPGNDAFVFHPGMGAETIANFNPQSDTIQLDSFANIQNVEQLAALITTDQHGDALIDLGHHESITVAGVSTTYLQQHLQGLVHLG